MFHVLLDASFSMHAYRDPVRSAYNRYLGWCQQHCSAFGQWQCCLFNATLQATRLLPVRHAVPLTLGMYTPEGGTALYDAIGNTLTPIVEGGQHILIVLSDGEDTDSVAWSETALHTLLTQRQAEGWLCVFLGAFPEALAVAQRCGFLLGNCLVFPGEQLPAAFERLRQATQRFLAAPVPERKLLAAGGVL